MTLTTDFDRLFVEGFSTLLATARIGLTLDTTQVDGIYLFAAPPDTPGRCVWLAPYWLGDDPALADSTRGLQVGVRSAGEDPRPASLLDDQIANVLLGLYGFTLPSGVDVASLDRTSATALMQEQSGSLRWWKTSNYTVLTYRPSLNRH